MSKHFHKRTLGRMMDEKFHYEETQVFRREPAVVAVFMVDFATVSEFQRKFLSAKIRYRYFMSKFCVVQPIVSYRINT